ncbi:MAG: alpha/beta fold hydrolase [Solirubrobacteraceae bacterium]
MRARLAAAALAALAGVVAAPAPAPAAAGGLVFGACPESARQARWECATLRVPLDRARPGRASLGLRVQRLRQAGARAGTLVLLAGGPGQSATSVADQVAGAMAPALDRYRLVLFDQRGTGRSGALRCPLDASGWRSAVAEQVACARRLGSRGTHYTTDDSVADLESLRVALGAPRLFLFGVSYGTFVATQYAREHPSGVERLALDSPLAARGWDALFRPTYASVPRVLRSLCGGGACRGVTRDPVRDLAQLVSALDRIERPDRVRGALPVGASSVALASILLAGDGNAGLRALWPAAVRAAVLGDGRALGRLAKLTGSLRGGAGLAPDRVSEAVNFLTSCQDAPMPWNGRERGAAARARAVWRAALRVPRASLAPFSPAAMAGASKARECIGIPRAGIDRVARAPLPRVPALVLSGEQDLRTPLSEARTVARELPGSALVAVAGEGHSVIGDRSCARVALGRFAHDRPVGTPCASDRPLVDPAPLPAPSVARLPAAPGLGGAAGRTLVAVGRTVSDALVVAVAIWSTRASFSVADLRGGTIGGDLPGGSLRLRHAVFVPGVAVTGTIVLGQDGGGTLAVGGVRGAVSGSVRIGPAGTSGVLGGRRFGVAARASARPAGVLRVDLRALRAAARPFG